MFTYYNYTFIIYVCLWDNDESWPDSKSATLMIHDSWALPESWTGKHDSNIEGTWRKQSFAMHCFKKTEDLIDHRVIVSQSVKFFSMACLTKNGLWTWFQEPKINHLIVRVCPDWILDIFEFSRLSIDNWVQTVARVLLHIVSFDDLRYLRLPWQNVLADRVAGEEC